MRRPKSSTGQFVGDLTIPKKNNQQPITLSDSPLQTSETESPKETINKNTMFSCQPCGSNIGHEMNMENAIQDVKKLEKHQILHNKNCSSPDPVSLRYLQCLNHRSPASGKRLPSPQPNITEHDQWNQDAPPIAALLMSSIC